MRHLYVPIGPEVLQELSRRAQLERRHPRQEAAILIERALGLRPSTEQPADEERQGVAHVASD